MLPVPLPATGTTGTTGTTVKCGEFCPGISKTGQTHFYSTGTSSPKVQQHFKAKFYALSQHFLYERTMFDGMVRTTTSGHLFQIACVLCDRLSRDRRHGRYHLPDIRGRVVSRYP
jgi:hypothetical protein